MTAIMLFIMLHIFALVSFLLRDKLIEGMLANNKIDDVRTLAHWESMIIESKTAREKMVYMRLADEIRAKLISDVESELAKSDFKAPIMQQEKQKQQTSNPVPEEVQNKPEANVVSLADRRRSS